MRLILRYTKDEYDEFRVHYQGAWESIYNPRARDQHYHNWNMWWGSMWNGSLELVVE